RPGPPGRGARVPRRSALRLAVRPADVRAGPTGGRRRPVRDPPVRAVGRPGGPGTRRVAARRAVRPGAVVRHGPAGLRRRAHDHRSGGGTDMTVLLNLAIGLPLAGCVGLAALPAATGRRWAPTVGVVVAGLTLALAVWIAAVF